MMKAEEIKELIEWGKEEKQPDFVEFVSFFRDRRDDKKSITVIYNGKTIEGYVFRYNFTYKKPFQDFDFICWIGDAMQPVVLKYTYMNLIKKTNENDFCIETQKGMNARICFKEAE